jgi:hypothetical protein
MKSITFACLSCLALLTFQAAGEPAKNEFSIVIESIKCSVKAYKATAPIVLEPLVNKDSIPKSQIIIAIMLDNSDISSYMSDEELFKFTGARLDKEAIERDRSRMKKMYEVTGPNAADNPWKGMKYLLEDGFVVESEKGKFLVYQLSTLGMKDNSGKLSGSIKNVAGTWMVGGIKGEEGQKFQGSMVKLVRAEFAKLQQASSIEALPFEDLLK